MEGRQTHSTNQVPHTQKEAIPEAIRYSNVQSWSWSRDQAIGNSLLLLLTLLGNGSLPVRGGIVLTRTDDPAAVRWNENKLCE
jgi:hypothetical protein